MQNDKYDILNVENTEITFKTQVSAFWPECALVHAMELNDEYQAVTKKYKMYTLKGFWNTLGQLCTVETTTETTKDNNEEFKEEKEENEVKFKMENRIPIVFLAKLGIIFPWEKRNVRYDFCWPFMAFDQTN